MSVKKIEISKNLRKLLISNHNDDNAIALKFLYDIHKDEIFNIFNPNGNYERIYVRESKGEDYPINFCSVIFRFKDFSIFKGRLYYESIKNENVSHPAFSTLYTLIEI